MSTATKSPPTSKELQLVLEGIRKKRDDLNRKFEADPLDYSLTSEIALLGEAERRMAERIEDAQKREQAADASKKQARVTKAYISKCKEIGELQERVERLVDELIIQSDQLRESYKAVNSLAGQLEEIPTNVRPPAPLWQRHGGRAVPYAQRVRNAIQSL